MNQKIKKSMQWKLLKKIIIVVEDYYSKYLKAILKSGGIKNNYKKWKI